MPRVATSTKRAMAESKALAAPLCRDLPSAAMCSGRMPEGPGEERGGKCVWVFQKGLSMLAEVGGCAAGAELAAAAESLRGGTRSSLPASDEPSWSSRPRA